MFGIGFTELLLISIIAILFLGPDKLPETMVQIAKFIKSVQKTVGDAKNSLEEEMKIADLKAEALSYKKQLDSASNELRSFKNIDYNDILNDEKDNVTPAKAQKEEEIVVEQKSETVTYEKKSRKRKTKKALAKEEQTPVTNETPVENEEMVVELAQNTQEPKGNSEDKEEKA